MYLLKSNSLQKAKNPKLVLLPSKKNPGEKRWQRVDGEKRAPYHKTIKDFVYNIGALLNKPESRRTRESIFSSFDNKLQQVGEIKKDFASRIGLKDNKVYTGKAYFLNHHFTNHPNEQPVRYYTIPDVLSNPSEIRLDNRDGKEGMYAFLKQYDKHHTVVVDIGIEKGHLVLHKTFFSQRKRPYKKLPLIWPLKKSFVGEGGFSSISPVAKATPAEAISALPTNETFPDNLIIANPEKGNNCKMKKAFSLPINNKISNISDAPGGLHPHLLVKSRSLHGRLEFQGLQISVENRRGSIRQWYDPHNGENGTTRMKHPYGYIRLTEGSDGDHVDCYVGPHKDARFAYIVHQMKAPEFKTYDEDKVMLGFASQKEAKKAYLAHYNDPRFLGSITKMPMEEFKEKVLATKDKPGKLRKALAGAYLIKSHVSSYYRRTKSGITHVRDYDTSRFRSLPVGTEVYFKPDEGDRERKGVIVRIGERIYLIRGRRDSEGKTETHTVPKGKVKTAEEHKKKPEKDKKYTKGDRAHATHQLTAEESKKRKAMAEKRLGVTEKDVLTSPLLKKIIDNVTGKIVRQNRLTPNGDDHNDLKTEYILGMINALRREGAKAPKKDLAEFKEFLSGSRDKSRIFGSMHMEGKTAALRFINNRNARTKELVDMQAGEEDPAKPDEETPGVVSIVAMPKGGGTLSSALRDAIREYLDTRRLVTAQLYVIDPEYIPVDIEATVSKTEEANTSALEDKVKDVIEEFLDPEYGGDAQKAVDYIEGISLERGSGWEFGRDVYLSELYELMERIPGVDHVEAISAPASNLVIEKNQLPLVGTVSITVV